MSTHMDGQIQIGNGLCNTKHSGGLEKEIAFASVFAWHPEGLGERATSPS
jgi:hypothetical protein